MELEKYIEYIECSAVQFGAKFDENAVKRNRCNVPDTTNFYAIMEIENPSTGTYSGLSYVIFPATERDRCLITIACGTDGLGTDQELASLPGMRRGILRIQRAYRKEVEKNEQQYPISCKQSFDDIKYNMPCLDKTEEDKNFKDACKRYGKYILASVMVNISKLPESKDEIKEPTVATAMLALYAQYRGWARNESERKAIAKNIEKYKITPKNIEEKQLDEVKKLLITRKYVVLQGAPGTGKTWLSAKIASDGLKEGERFSKVYFTQFHAETTYSDFVYGIEPSTNKDGGNAPKFVLKKGKLYEAIEEAERNQSLKGDGAAKPVLLLIDEINRGNLSNVLGEALFLFEKDSLDPNYKLRIGDLQLSKIPDNLYVLATMNTSDRSLAVIDFALRRRFAWYTMKPHKLAFPENGRQHFHDEIYSMFETIFDKYANDAELSLQPGQAYFITKEEEDLKEEDHKKIMKKRMQYELMPLIKEYLDEGYLIKAKTEFCNLFFNETGLDMYE